LVKKLAVTNELMNTGSTLGLYWSYTRATLEEYWINYTGITGILNDYMLAFPKFYKCLPINKALILRYNNIEGNGLSGLSDFSDS